MPEQPEDPYVMDEPRTEPRTLDSRRSRSQETREHGDERPPLRRIAFWVAVGLVIAAGVALYFLFADAVVPVLRTDP